MTDSPQTVRNAPGRTVEVLREEMLALIAAQNRMIDERADALQVATQQATLAAKEAIAAALTAQKEATANALAASDRAVTKAEAATEKRFEGVNEFRQQLSDQARTFMPRSESESQHVAISDKFASLETSWANKLTVFEDSMNAKLIALDKVLTERANANATRLTTIEGKGQGAGQMISWVAIMASILFGIIGIGLHFLK